MPTPGLEPLSHGRTGPRGRGHLGGRFVPDSRSPSMPPKIKRQQYGREVCHKAGRVCTRALAWVGNASAYPCAAWDAYGYGGMGGWPGLQRCGLYVLCMAAIGLAAGGGGQREAGCPGTRTPPEGKFSLGVRRWSFACSGSPPCASETGRAHSPGLSASPWLLSASLRRAVDQARCCRGTRVLESDGRMACGLTKSTGA